MEDHFDAMLAAEREKAREEVSATAKRLAGAPVLWEATVLQHDPSLQGHVMLRGSKPGATVEVLEESVGAGERYHRVRDRATGSLGLLPSDWVRRVV